MRTVRFLMIALMFAGVTTSVAAQKKVNPVGTWAYEASQAPYEYSSGDFVIEKDGKEYTVKIVLGEYYSVKGSNVKFEKNELSFTVYIEGESVQIKGTMDKESFDGTASYSEGTIPVKAKKKKKE